MATVTVNAASTLCLVPKTALGVNTAVWDGDLLDSSIPSLLKGINTEMLRYPGGSTSDVYHWQTNTVNGGGSAGTGTADEAAAWVKYADVTNHYGVKYWEIGNELYGSCEAGNFAGNPTGYADEASQFITAMKVVDSSVKIGVDLTTYHRSWNTTVLSELKKDGSLPDLAIVHWYDQNPGGETDSSLLSSTKQIGPMMNTL